MPINQRTMAAGAERAEAYTLINTNGLEAEIMTYGGTLRALRAPGRDGRLDDIVLGFDTLGPYLGPHPFFGSLVGRYANRIRAGRFTLDGEAYTLPINDGPNHLHGGPAGFHRVTWEAQPLAAPDGPSLTLAYSSPDGEAGFPGTLGVVVTYTLTDSNDLRIDYEARSDRPTVINLTNHAYFNLAGAGTIERHELQLAASRFLPIDAHALVTGELRAVAETPFDFRRPAVIGERLGLDDEQLRLGGGFDHCYVLDKAPDELAFAGLVVEPESGRSLEVFTTQPGVQFFGGNFHDASYVGKGGQTYGLWCGLCLEAQDFPDAPNQPHFPSTVLRPGERYRQTTVYRLGIR